ncbi:putative reverse transcriptase zinc-binding domain-containing protein [Helianthus debilis subsp. tardiflorus]
MIRGVWLNICNLLNKPCIDNKPIRSFFRGVVASGNDIMFWLDPWASETLFKETFPCLFQLEVVKNCSVRDRLAGGIWWLWRHDPESALESQELATLSAMVSSVTIGSGPDKWKWMGDPAGLFSVKSVKDHLIRGICDPNLFVFDWCKCIPLKCNIFAWRLELNRIPTLDALFARGIVNQVGACPLCGCEDESAMHLFISCHFASLIWHKVSIWCRIPMIFAFSVKDLLECHKFSRLNNAEAKILQGIIIISCWSIWLSRNKAIFSGSHICVEDVFSEIRSLGYFWLKHRSSFRSISWNDWCKFVIM